jgi:hypothetical protein
MHAYMYFERKAKGAPAANSVALEKEKDGPTHNTKGDIDQEANKAPSLGPRLIEDAKMIAARHIECMCFAYRSS